MLTVGSVVLRWSDLERRLMCWTAALDCEPRIHLDLDAAPGVAA